MDEATLLLVKGYLEEQGYYRLQTVEFTADKRVVFEAYNHNKPAHGVLSCKFVLYPDADSARRHVKRIKDIYGRLGSSDHIHALISCVYLCFKKQNKHFMLQVSEWAKCDLQTEINSRLADKNYWKEKEVLEYLEQVVELLRKAQILQIAHLDIKPMNLFFDKFNRILVGDFGISQQLDSDDLTLDVFGTPAFMEPELREAYIQHNPRLHRNPYKGDVYSLGLTFKETIGCISDYSPVGKLAKVLDRMLDKNQQKRPDFLELTEFLHSESLSRQLLHDPTKIYRCVHILMRVVSAELTLVCGHKLCEDCVQMQGNVYNCLVCPRSTLSASVTRRSLIS